MKPKKLIYPSSINLQPDDGEYAHLAPRRIANSIKMGITIITIINLITVIPVHAQSPSPTSGSIRDSVKQQVDQELSQIKSRIVKKAFVGSISAKSDGTITITNLQGQSRTALVTADATVKLAGNKDGTPADLKTGDFIIAMGDADTQNQLTIKRLLVASKPTEDKRKVYYGTVKFASSSTLTIETTDKKSVDIKRQSSTKYTGTTKSADVKAGAKVVLVSSSSFVALTLHLLP